MICASLDRMIRKSSLAADRSQIATGAATCRRSVAHVIGTLVAARRAAAERRSSAVPSLGFLNLADVRAQETQYSAESSRQKLPASRQKIPTKYMKNNRNSPPGWTRATVQHDEAGRGWGQRRCGLEGAK